MCDYEDVEEIRLAESPRFVFPFLVDPIEICDGCYVDKRNSNGYRNMQSIIVYFLVDVERSSKSAICQRRIERFGIGALCEEVEE